MFTLKYVHGEATSGFEDPFNISPQISFKKILKPPLKVLRFILHVGIGLPFRNSEKSLSTGKLKPLFESFETAGGHSSPSGIPLLHHSRCRRKKYKSRYLVWIPADEPHRGTAAHGPADKYETPTIFEHPFGLAVKLVHI